MKDRQNDRDTNIKTIAAFCRSADSAENSIQQKASEADSISQSAGRAGQHSLSQESQSGSQPACEPVKQPASPSVSQPGRQTGSQPATKPAASQPGSQAAIQPASEPASQPANEIVLLGVALLYESPGGNQVDGLPPVPTLLS